LQLINPIIFTIHSRKNQVPCVSVNIVTYNNALTIIPCLEALMAQEGDFEVIIIDNASADNTVELAQSMNLPITLNNHNLGYSVAHNQALANSDSKYVLTLNPDVALQPDFIQQMVTALENDPTLGSAAGCLLRVNKLGDTPIILDSTGLYMRRTRRQGLRFEGADIDKRPMQSGEIFGPDGAAAFYRRAMLDDIATEGEIFDGDFFTQKADIDLCWRAQLRGWKSLYVPDAVAHHVRTFRPGHRKNVSPSMRIYGVQNRYLLMMKNEVARLFWRDFWAISIYDIAILLYILMRERDSFSALVSAWKLRKRMMHKRRIIHANRTVTTQEMRRWLRA
jgi:GT2 family glycosyltransferase